VGDDEQLSDEEKARRGEEIVDAELTGARESNWRRPSIRKLLKPQLLIAEYVRANARSWRQARRPKSLAEELRSDEPRLAETIDGDPSHLLTRRFDPTARSSSAT
jgi:hypothetical protein